ncbi:MAG: 50S ribosomal protein L21e [Candidatus Hadarchaeia archaeon]
MTKSKGKRSKTRQKLQKGPRSRGKVYSQNVVQSYPKGSKATIKINPDTPEGQPHPKFHGRTGVIKRKQGKSYIIAVKDGNGEKEIITRPEHLVKVKK